MSLSRFCSDIAVLSCASMIALTLIRKDIIALWRAKFDVSEAFVAAQVVLRSDGHQ